MKPKITDNGIFIPLQIGQVIGVGRFRNKKIKVKNIDITDDGLPTVNGRKILTFKYIMDTLD